MFTVELETDLVIKILDVTKKILICFGPILIGMAGSKEIRYPSSMLRLLMLLLAVMQWCVDVCSED